MSYVQVQARYLQPKQTAGGPQHASITGRASLAGSTGWIEMQHPNHASTPLMVPAGSVGSAFASTAHGSKTRSGMCQPTPTAGTGSRQSAQRAAEQQFVTPGPAATPRFGQGMASRGAVGASTAHSKHQALQTPRGLTMSAAVSRPPATVARLGVQSADLTGTVSAQSCMADSDMRAKLSAWKEQKQQQAVRTAAKPAVFKEPAPKPTLFRATAATRVNKDPATSKKVAASSNSAGRSLGAERSSTGSAAAMPGAAAHAASKSAAASTVTSPGASSNADSAAGPAAPSASPSAFAATMATLHNSGGKPRAGRPNSGKASSSRPSPVPLLPLAQAGIGSSSPAAGLQQQHVQSHAVGCSPLTGTRSCTKIPKPDMSSLTGNRQQQPAGDQQPLASSRGQHHAPLFSRWPATSGGGEAVPDATPRTARDSLPSRVPRTPRTVTHAASRQQAALPAVTPEGNDRAARQVDTLKSAAESRSSPFAAGSGKASVPKLKLSELTKSPGPEVAGALHQPRAAVGGHSCLSARAPGATVRGQAAAALPKHGMPSARNRTSSDGTPTARHRASNDGSGAAGTPASARQRGRTPRGAAPAAAVRPTPRSLSSSLAAAGPTASTGAAGKKAEADKAEEVRQQLRLLRMQQLQLRHLNARMEAAQKARKEKVCTRAPCTALHVLERVSALIVCSAHPRCQHILHGRVHELAPPPCCASADAFGCPGSVMRSSMLVDYVQVEASVAAAAAAVVNLSGQLLRAKDQAQKADWQSQLKRVLQEQHTQLQAWAQAQVGCCQPVTIHICAAKLDMLHWCPVICNTTYAVNDFCNDHL